MNKFLKTMKRFGYISIETVIVAAIMIVAIFTFLGAFVEKGQTASNDAASKIDDVLNLAGGGEGAGPGGSGGGAGGGELPEVPGGPEEPVTMEAGLYDADGNQLASWDILVAPVSEGGYGLDLTVSYHSSSASKSNANSISYILNNNSELQTGTKLVMGEGPTKIGSYAFSGNEQLVDVVISASVTAIQTAAFSNCTSLETVSFAENSQLKEIWGDAFNTSKKLTTVEIPSTVTFIGSYAFYNCSSLESVAFGDNSQLKTIDMQAFAKCSSLKEIVIPASTNTIGSDAFYSCKALESVVFSDNSQLTTIGSSAFQATSLKTINLEKNQALLEVGSYAFAGNSNLTNIEIPASVTTIGEMAFYYCESLASINVEAGNQNYASEYGVLYDKQKSTLISYPVRKAETTFVIPEGVEKIDQFAFYGSSNLTNLVVPKSVTFIGYNAFRGGIAVNYCGIDNIYYPGTRAEWVAITKDGGESEPSYYANMHYESTGPSN